jgi:hypothetical protein
MENKGYIIPEREALSEQQIYDRYKRCKSTLSKFTIAAMSEIDVSELDKIIEKFEKA